MNETCNSTGSRLQFLIERLFRGNRQVAASVLSVSGSVLRAVLRDRATPQQLDTVANALKRYPGTKINPAWFLTGDGVWGAPPNGSLNGKSVVDESVETDHHEEDISLLYTVIDALEEKVESLQRSNGTVAEAARRHTSEIAVAIRNELASMARRIDAISANATAALTQSKRTADQLQLAFDSVEQVEKKQAEQASETVKFLQKVNTEIAALKSAQAAAKATPAVITEETLRPEELLTISQWLAVPGNEHAGFLAAPATRRAMGQYLSRTYEAAGISNMVYVPGAHSKHHAFTAADMREYAAWYRASVRRSVEEGKAMPKFSDWSEHAASIGLPSHKPCKP